MMIKKEREPSIFGLLGDYKGMLFLLLLFALLSNGINLVLPKIIANGIDGFATGQFNLNKILLQFSLAAIAVFIFTYLQSIVQTLTSERVAKNLRSRLSDKIAKQNHAYITTASPSKLLTNLTSDVDAIKMFVAQAVASIISSVFIIIGASSFLLSINWKLALCVIAIVPIIGTAFYFVLTKARAIFKRSREIIDWLNKVINESILGAALIRIVNSQQFEYNKFLEANEKAKHLGIATLRLFATLIPIIIFVSNLAVLSILVLGGHFVITNSMTLGEFTAFNSYLALLIFPIMVIGLMSNFIAQASASFQRISSVLYAQEIAATGTIEMPLSGDMEILDLSLNIDQKPVLKSVSFSVKRNSKTAIIGPTAAGKTQLLYCLTGLLSPDQGKILFDGHKLTDYEPDHFYRQIGFVFQDSIVFNVSIRQNIAFSDNVTDASLAKAIETAALESFIDKLPNQLDTVVSERGNSLSGGQKQRIMLARALAVNPKILLLDDFTARVDYRTEQKILQHIEQNYPDITLLSVTQKISSIMHYDNIILLMQGEIVAQGTHEELLKNSPEYVQIFNSQQSTNSYEL